MIEIKKIQGNQKKKVVEYINSREINIINSPNNGNLFIFIKSTNLIKKKLIYLSNNF